MSKKIEAQKKNTAYFISNVDGKMYSLIKSLVSPENVANVSYETLKNYYRTFRAKSQCACREIHILQN